VPQRGDVPEIANHTVAALRKRDTVDLPLIDLADSAVTALLDPLGDNVWFSFCQCMAKSCDDFIRVGF
jgi:hypothetical protein